LIVSFSILLFSKSDCVLVLCCIYLHILTASTRRVQYFVVINKYNLTNKYVQLLSVHTVAQKRREEVTNKLKQFTEIKAIINHVLNPSKDQKRTRQEI